MTSTYNARLTAQPRQAGALVGLLIAVLFAASGLPEGSSRGSADAPSAIWAIAMLLAGGIGGWLFGPAGIHPTTARSWIAVIVGLAGIAVVVGAFAVTLPLAAATAAPLASGPIDGVASVLTNWLAFAVLGILILGVPALVLTLLPAGIWAVTMAWLADRAAP